jgi:carbonic anhydrase
MSIMDQIRHHQANAVRPSHQAPPVHQPEMLYIGCIDARLDPIMDIGIGKGKALIFRNIGALVLKDEHASVGLDHAAISAWGEIPPNVSIGAVLEFFLNHFPHEQGRVKHIVVSGHTDCGGLKACQNELCDEHDHYLPLYLESLREVRDRIRGEARALGWDDARLLHALEEESVRQSMKNLKSYPVVTSALQEGWLEIHGWVINTATQRIYEMNLDTLEFEPMSG